METLDRAADQDAGNEEGARAGATTADDAGAGLRLAGESIDMTVAPFASFRLLSDFQKALGQLHGVRSLRIRRFQRGTLYLTVEYNGVIALEERLRELTRFKVAISKTGPDSVEIQIGLPQDRILSTGIA